MFGGSCAEFTEGQQRSLGNTMHDICIFDDAKRAWEERALDDDTGVGVPNAPERRELSQIV